MTRGVALLSLGRASGAPRDLEKAVSPNPALKGRLAGLVAKARAAAAGEKD